MTDFQHPLSLLCALMVPPKIYVSFCDVSERRMTRRGMKKRVRKRTRRTRRRMLKQKKKRILRRRFRC